MRDCSPMTTSPVSRRRGRRGGAPWLVSVATSIRRIPPRAGAGNSCDSSCSPSTSVVALTVAPGVHGIELRAPALVGLDRDHFRPDVQVDRWPAMLFDSSPRIRRTEIDPLGRSSTGRGMPDICFGSGIAKPPCCAPTGSANTEDTEDTEGNRSYPPAHQPTAARSASQLRPAALAELRVAVVGRLARGAETLG